jgi:hypothetical protein
MTQLRLLTMRSMADHPTRYARANAARVSPAAKRERMSLADSAVSLALGFRSPWLSCLPRARCRTAMSRILSAWLPATRCAGLQHGGLSQTCRTLTSGRSCPCCDSYTALWAWVYSVPVQKFPYPDALQAPVHGQHPSGSVTLSTLLQSRSTSSMGTNTENFRQSKEPDEY